MIDQAIVVSIVFCGFITAALALTQVIGALISDIQVARLLRGQRLHPTARRYRHRPLITVVIATHNDARVIEHCLHRLVKNSYRKLQIIVADNKSTDDTKKIVKTFMAQHPNKSMKLYYERRRSAVTKSQVVARARERYAAGELILYLQPSDQLDATALKKAVAYFNSDKSVDSLIMAEQLQTSATVAGLIYKYLHLMQQRAQKISCRPISQSARIIQRVALSTLDSQQQFYAADVSVIVKQRVSIFWLLGQQYKALLYRGRLAQARRRRLSDHTGAQQLLSHWLQLLVDLYLGTAQLLMPLLTSYFVYLALSIHNTTLLFASWAMMAIFLGLAIWDNSHLGIRQKLVYTVGIPVTYMALFAISFLRIPVYVRLLLSRRSVQQI